MYHSLNILVDMVITFRYIHIVARVYPETHACTQLQTNILGVEISSIKNAVCKSPIISSFFSYLFLSEDRLRTIDYINEI